MCKYPGLFLTALFLSVNFCNAQKLSNKERKVFQDKCEQLAQTFCGYIEEITEENSNNKDMTITEFYDTEVCQWTISQMRKFFSNQHLKSGKIIGYTQRDHGRPVTYYTSIENYISMLLKQRQRYRTVRYDFSTFMVTDLVEKTDKNGEIYYQGEVKFKQNFFASKNHEGNSELGWDVFHEDFKVLTFNIQLVKTKDGKFYAITFNKLEIDLEAY